MPRETLLNYLADFVTMQYLDEPPGTALGETVPGGRLRPTTTTASPG